MPTIAPTLTQVPPEVLGGQFTLWPEAEPGQAALDFCHFPGPLVWTFLRKLPRGDQTWRTVSPWREQLADQAAINARHWPPTSNVLDTTDSRQIELDFFAKHGQPNQLR